MAFYEKWQSEIYSIGCKVWIARCPNCHYPVESSEPISSNYRFCPYCGFDMKSNIKSVDVKYPLPAEDKIASLYSKFQHESCAEIKDTDDKGEARRTIQMIKQGGKD